MSEENDLAIQVEELTNSLQTMQTKLNERDQELERLRTHSAKLLDEKKKLKQFEGLGDPEQIRNIMTQFENDEDAQLVAEGKFKEVLNKHTERLSLSYKQKLDEFNDKVNTLSQDKNKFENLYHESMAGHAVSAAARQAGVRDTAIEDIMMRARGVFRVSDDNNLEARDKDGKLITVGNKALTPEVFVQQLKDKYPHYWPDSQSAGAAGSAGNLSKENPFKKGPSFSRTKQAQLRKTDPDLAQQLEQEANEAA